jgi:hypothetical protein
MPVAKPMVRTTPRTTVRLVAAVSTLALLLVLLQPTDLARAEEDRAIAAVAAMENLDPAELTVLEADSATLPLTGAERETFKVQAADGETYAVSFRAGTDEIVDADEEIAAELDERDRTKLSPELTATLAGMRGNDRVEVAIWAALEDVSRQGRQRSDAAFAAVEERAGAARAPIAGVVRGFGAEAQVAEVDLAPVVTATLNKGQINGLSRRPDVERIEHIPEVDAHLDDSTTTTRFVHAWTGAQPLTGRFSTVAVHEAGGVDDVNPFMPPVRHWSETQGNPKNIQQHPTNVAGVIGSRHPWRRGGAFQVNEILSANFPSYGSPLSEFTASAAWAIRSGADVINMSWGTVCSGGNTDFFSRWVDYLISTFGVLVVASAGNSSCGGDVTNQFVGSPSLGRNTLSVGSAWDSNTGLRGDDGLSSFSSWVNPTDPVSGGKYEKPDVVAPGGQVAGGSCFGVATLAIGSGFNETCGTSFSSPETAALAGAIVGRNRALRFSPETVKAIIMAGATQNVVDGGNFRSCSSSPLPNDCRDGAGGIDAFHSRAILRDGDFRSIGHVTAGSWPTGSAGDKVYNIPLTANVPMRSVLAWNSTAECTNLGTPTQVCASDVLNADLDLLLYNPDGALVASAQSIYNAVEVIDYTPPTSGTYQLRVRNFSFTANTSTYVGLAWNRDVRDTRNALTGQTVLPLGQRTALQTTRGGMSNWDSYQGEPAECVGFMNNSTGPEKIYRVQLPSPGSITATLSAISPDPSGYGQIDVDVAILRRPGGVGNDEINQHMLGCGDTVATASGLSSGFYYVVVDGWNGSLARYRLRVDFTPTSDGAAPLQQQPLPSR